MCTIDEVLIGSNISRQERGYLCFETLPYTEQVTEL